MFFNIDGNKSNFDCFVAELSSINHEFSIIGLAETNIDPSLKNLYPITNYNSFYQDTIDNKNKGTGVALYVHNSLNAVVNQELSQITSDIESLFVNITHHDKNINVGVIYRPPSGNTNNFFDEFSKIITKIPNNNPTYIMGDFNINLHDSKSSSTLQFEELFLSQGLFPLVSIITHEKLHCKGSCIDNIFSNNVDNIILSGTISAKLTSHSPIFSLSKLQLHNVKQKLPPQTLYYDYSDKNIKCFSKDLKTNLEKSNDTEPNFSIFIETFNESLDKTCKLDKPKTTKRTTSNNPWITEGIIRSINNKHELYKKWKKTCNAKQPTGDPNQYKKFSDFRRNLKKIIKHAKTNFYNNKFEKCTGDIKKTWGLINQIRGKNKKSMKPQFIINNERIIERRVIANEFNKYFASIASTMNQNFDTHDDGIPINKVLSFEEYMPKSNIKSMFVFECTSDEISQIINELQNGKSSDVPIKVIKKVSPIISPYLEIHYNYLLSNGKFPDELKVGKITPIYKKHMRSS